MPGPSTNVFGGLDLDGSWATRRTADLLVQLADVSLDYFSGHVGTRSAFLFRFFIETLEVMGWQAELGHHEL